VVLEKRELGYREKRLVQGAQAHLRLAREKLRQAVTAIPQGASRLLGGKRTWLSEAEKRLLRGSFRELGQAKEEIGVRARRVGELARRKLAQEVERLSGREGRLRALDPKRVVERGFAILRLPTGKVVTDPAQAPEGTPLTAELRAGILRLLSQGGERAGQN
jgi:exodeoxyribonuclease VII large subunit